ncbi:MAG: nucleotidyl transferase AbiEii/AbiGii toxin family protein [Thermoguttaceae bacterium]|nr:nucleotidyl transferase AbiEii/AbiGii toxin family protein [Thermoguttaceae bacterium]
MITKNPMQFKALVKKRAAEKNVSAQSVMQSYMLERLLERISTSKYKRNFIIKGGFLISSLVGLEARTTMDLDTTVKGFTLMHESIRKIIEEICAIEIEDDIAFELEDVSDIREGDDYPGLRVRLKANYPPISVPLTVDVTTGDVVTPKEVEHVFPLLFDNRTISVFAYNLETVFAEKIETILSRNVANTRPRDFYDIHILYVRRGVDCDMATLKQALERTANKRGSRDVMDDYLNVVEEIQSSEQLQNFWKKYQRDFDYAKAFTFNDVCDSVRRIMDDLAALGTNET